MRILSDPVTVTEERPLIIPLYEAVFIIPLCFKGKEQLQRMRRGEGAMILESGNLLCMARLNFRVKCSNQLGESAAPECCLLVWKQAFFMEFACSY